MTRSNKKSLFIILFLNFIFTPLIALCQSVTIDVISKNLSHRVLVLDTVETRLKLIIGFSVTGDLPSGPEGTKAYGLLSFQSSEVASFTMPKLDYFGGNLVFYMPYNIAPGDYDLSIELKDIASGSTIGTKNYTVQSIETMSSREPGSGYNWMDPPPVPLNNPPDEILEAAITPADNERGYILWHRNPFRYVYPNSAPKQADVISAISSRLAQNKYEPSTFSLYALQDLGNVNVSVSSLIDGSGHTLSPPDIFVVKTVARCKDRSNPEDGYELRPRLLEKKNFTPIGTGQSQRFWLTFHAVADTEPGQYNGIITITTDIGLAEIPVSVEILPFALLERPDKEYGFQQTYVFQEMTAQDLSDVERQKVYDNGLKYYQSFKKHGITTIFPHCPFVFRRLPDGSPDLRDLEAALTAFNEVGFSGPFIYYTGHMVQNSKPGWAGSSLGFDETRHPLLMKEIINYARQNFSVMSSVDFYWMPGDEVHGNRGGPDRIQITDKLLNVIWELNEKTLINVKSQVAWPLDIKLVKEEWGSAQPLYGEPWHYPNTQTTVPDIVDDAEGIRKYFGLYHVKSPYVGMVPWTFQTSENAGGDPYTDLDAKKTPEVMVAYPGTDGPMPTPEYEAVREGIDDGRYAFALETRIDSAKNSPDTGLQNLGLQLDAAYQAILDTMDNASLEDMDENRETILSWIMQLYGQDKDGDGIPDDGDGSGNREDNPCRGGNRQSCDDNCIDLLNPDQTDADADAVGDVCDPCSMLPVRVEGTHLLYYSSIQSAYDAAGNDGIQSQHGIFSEDLNFNLEKVIILEGGHDCNYQAVVGNTIVEGTFTVSNGTVILENGMFVIQ